MSGMLQDPVRYALLSGSLLYVTVGSWLASRGIGSLLEPGFGFEVPIAGMLRGDWAPTSLRLPLIPGFATLVHLAGGGLLFATWLKNAALCALLYGAFARAALTVPIAWVLAVAALVLTDPHWSLWALRLVPEEGWIIPALAFGFACVLWPTQSRSWLSTSTFAACIAALILVKSSLLAASIALASLHCLRARDVRVTCAVAAAVALGVGVLVSYNYDATGELRLGSSQDGRNLFKGNNPEAARLYPRHLDRLDPWVGERGLLTDSEWRWNDDYVRQTLEFWRTEPESTVHLTLLRVFRFYVAVGPYEFDHRSLAETAGRLLGSLFFLVFRVALLGSLGVALFSLARWLTRGSSALAGESACFLLLVGAYSAPYLLGFVYDRHLLPLFVPSYLFVLRVASELRRRVRLVTFEGASQVERRVDDAARVAVQARFSSDRKRLRALAEAP